MLEQLMTVVTAAVPGASKAHRVRPTRTEHEDMTCVEDLVRLLVLNTHGRGGNRQVTTSRIYIVLWWIFEGKLREVTVPQRRGALGILCMAGASEMVCVVDIALGDIANGDAGMTCSTCTKFSVVFDSAEDEGNWRSGGRRGRQAAHPACGGPGAHQQARAVCLFKIETDDKEEADEESQV